MFGSEFERNEQKMEKKGKKFKLRGPKCKYPNS